MAKSIKVHPKKKRGRPATGKDPLVSARLPQALIDQVETWAAANEASRSEAIRRLVELGLTVRPKARKSSEGQQLRAREMASVAIDSMTDGSAHPSDQDSRKRRLLKGPEEFRDVRVDRSTAKRK
jgi:Arc/MetJ-type ribon-helix-helix transcriptional regulator